MKRKIKINENHLKNIVNKSVKNLLKESLFDNAKKDFLTLREYYDDSDLIEKLWYYLDDKPGFIQYMKSSGQFPSDDSDDEYID